MKEIDLDKDTLDSIKTWVWSGFYYPNEVEEMVADILEEDVDEEDLRTAINSEFEKKLKAEKKWLPQTDCDRLDIAFETLNSNGIIALQNAGYTMSDGLDDVYQIYEDSEKSNFTGYCFYHQQDLERAVNGGGLSLAFGNFEDKSGKSEIGKIVKKILEDSGFKVEWDGNPEHRLNIPDIDWKRRAMKNSV